MLSEEWITSGLIGVHPIKSLTRRVDELARGGMMGWNTQVTGVTEGVLAFTACKKSVESGILANYRQH